MINSNVIMSQTHRSKWLVILCLIIAGEMVFSLPFHIARYFRPTVLDVFKLSNADLGDIFAIYGVTAMLAYFPGGLIADQVSARKLISASLFLTALGGIYMAQIPGPAELMMIFGYWGITSILLFWAALIRATREWGGELAQGKAFGFLDGGRGLVAAIFASLGVAVFTWALPDDGSMIDGFQRRQGIQAVIYYYSLMTLLVGLLAWFTIPDKSGKTDKLYNPANHILSISGRTNVWLLAVIVVCAYCGYKGLDNYGLYAVQVLEMDEIASANFTSLTAYLRPVAAIAAGIIADRMTSSKFIKISFTILIFSYLFLSVFDPENVMTAFIYLNLVVTLVAVFAIRGVYFALLEECKFPQNTTGAVVGIVSVIGFTPDVFFAPIAGRLLDASPGIQGHQHFFLMLSLIAVCGMLAAYSLAKMKHS